MSYMGCSSNCSGGGCGSYRPMDVMEPIRSQSPQLAYHNNAMSELYQTQVSHSVAQPRTEFDTGYAPNSAQIQQEPLPENMQELIKEAFEKTTNESFPNDIIIHLLDESEFKTKFNYPESVQGFAINRKHLNQKSEIFIKKQDLARTLLTIGHELGHVLTPTLRDKRAEEAKAYTFEVAFIQAIRKHNLAQISDLSASPAKNGLHDKAFNHIIKKLNEGLSTLQIYKELVLDPHLIIY